jgi:hypothetical protein
MQLSHLSAFLAWAAATAATLAPATPAQTLVRSVNGPTANALYGKACIVVPDQNGDGVKDLIVGAPGFDFQRGAIYCLSGAFLGFGIGAQHLWSLAPTANQGDLFGFAIADVGDITGDGVRDYLVGQPGYDNGFAQDVGATRLVNGSTHAIVSLQVGPEQACMFGSAIAACGDSNGDGKSEVAVGAPGPNSVHSYVYTISGVSLTLTGQVGSLCLTGHILPATHECGMSIASGADLDGDGCQEFIVGMPGAASAASGANSGALLVGSVKPSLITFFYPTFYVSTITGERLGSSVDTSSDYDGDGVVDIVVGAPNSPSTNSPGTAAGRVVVLSGAKLVAGTPPYEIYTFTTAGTSAYHFGTGVCAGGDLNNDGVGDILGGEPDFVAFGAVRIFSGATGAPMGVAVGGPVDHLGDSIAGVLKDLDNDGFKEFVIAGSRSGAGGTDSGVVKCYRLFPQFPAVYCTAKINSLGCSPAIGSSGSPSASSALPFLIGASNFVNQKSGLLFYSHAPIATAFQGGTLCVGSPTVRTPIQGSGGSASGADCTGTYSLDFNARIHSAVDASLVAGAQVFAQYWSRDPSSASQTSLSNAVRFVINP